MSGAPVALVDFHTGGHDVDKQGQTIKTAGTLLPWVRFSKGREEVVLPALFDDELVGQGVAYVMQIPLKLGYAVTTRVEINQ